MNAVAIFRVVRRHATQIARDFALFWGIRVPAWITRLAASLPAGHHADRAMYVVAAVAVVLLASGVLG